MTQLTFAGEGASLRSGAVRPNFAENFELPPFFRLPQRLRGLLFPSAIFATLFFASGTEAATFAPRSGEAPLAFTIPAYGTTMVAVPGDPIANAVYDRSMLDIQTDAAAGVVYVLPKVPGRAMIYVTCRSGDTAALSLTFAEEAEPRQIILEKREEKPANNANHPQTGLERPSAPLRSEGFPADMKRFITLVMRGDESDEAVKTTLKTPATGASRAMTQLAPLNVRLTAIWRSEEAEATVLSVRNGTISAVDLDVEALTKEALWAVAATRMRLQSGESTTLILVEKARD